MSFLQEFGNHLPGLISIARNTAISYVLIYVLLRLAGKRQLGQMNPLDIVVLLLVGNTFQSAMLGNDGTILGGLVAACTIIILNWAVDWIGVRSTWFRHTFEQSPTLLVHDGAMVADNLRKEGLPEEFLWQALREHGIAEIERVQLAVLETDGSVSIIERGVVVKRTKKTHPATRKDG